MCLFYESYCKEDTSEFYSKFYKPKFKDKYVKKYLLSKENFEDTQYQELGDNAIKHLYIPPFAIGMSLIAGILNLVSVIIMILFIIIKLDKLSFVQQIAIKSSLKLLLLIFIVGIHFMN